jgi:drug/metabolite transporter (DMT)-like permease
VNGNLLDASDVILALSLVATATFLVYYITTGGWRREPVGRIILIDRIIIFLLLLIIAIEAWGFGSHSNDVKEGLLSAGDVLLTGYAAVMVAATAYMITLRRHPAPKPRPTAPASGEPRQ